MPRHPLFYKGLFTKKDVFKKAQAPLLKKMPLLQLDLRDEYIYVGIEPSAYQPREIVRQFNRQKVQDEQLNIVIDHATALLSAYGIIPDFTTEVAENKWRIYVELAEHNHDEINWYNAVLWKGTSARINVWAILVSHIGTVVQEGRLEFSNRNANPQGIRHFAHMLAPFGIEVNSDEWLFSWDVVSIAQDGSRKENYHLRLRGEKYNSFKQFTLTGVVTDSYGNVMVNGVLSFGDYVKLEMSDV